MLLRINIFLYICCAFSGFIVATNADDLKLQDGRILKNYRVINHSPKDAMVIHDDGADTVLLKDFPEDLRKKYGYEEEKVKAYEAEQAKAQEKYKEHQEQRRIENQKRQAEFEEKLAEKKRLEELWSRSRYYDFTIISVTEDGILASEKEDTLETRIGDEGKLEKYHTTKDSDEIYYVIDAPVINAVDGKRFSGYCTRIGTYTYTAANGAKKIAAKLICLPHVFGGRNKAYLAPNPEEQRELFKEKEREATKYQDLSCLTRKA